MTPATSTLLTLILIALGIIGVILSFMVSDHKKSKVALVLAGLIVLVGVFEYSQESIARRRITKRMKEIEKDRQVDLDALREKLREQVKTPVTSSPAQVNK